jgi:hypothetical protein
MAKPKSTVRKGVRVNAAGKPVVVTTKKGKGLLNAALKAIGK